jgi:hypothetical protein
MEDHAVIDGDFLMLMGEYTDKVQAYDTRITRSISFLYLLMMIGLTTESIFCKVAPFILILPSLIFIWNDPVRRIVTKNLKEMVQIASQCQEHSSKNIAPGCEMELKFRLAEAEAVLKPN